MTHSASTWRPASYTLSAGYSAVAQPGKLSREACFGYSFLLSGVRFSYRVLNAPLKCEEHQKISAKAILPQLGY